MKSLIKYLLAGSVLLIPTVAWSTEDSINPSTKSYRVKCYKTMVDDDYFIGSGFFVNGGDKFITAQHVIAECGSNLPINILSDKGVIGEYVPEMTANPGDISIGKVRLDSPRVVKTYNMSCAYPTLNATIYSHGHPEGHPKDTTQRAQVKIDPFKVPDHSNDVIVSSKYIGGMSGGPVTDTQGNVVGIVRWTYTALPNRSGFASIVPVCNQLNR